jgi:predicted alpha/beta hydrolase
VRSPLEIEARCATLAAMPEMPPGRGQGRSNGVHARARFASSASPAAFEVESIDLRTRDGWSLRADVMAPATGPSAGVAVLAHAAMARRSEFSRPPGAGVAAFLAGRGWRVVAFDFRGHGDSRPPPLRDRPAGAAGYDDLVNGDLATVCAFAREQAQGAGPVVVVGHSLGGHTTLAAQGSGAIAVDGVAGIACGPPFLRDHEPSRARWLAKRAVFASMLALARRAGRFPARAMRLGSDDESLACCEDFDRVARTGRWTSRDGRVDYLEALGEVRVPVLQVVSTADRFECVPECGELLVACCRGPREVVRVTGTDGGGPAPSHMGLVTSGQLRSVWESVEAWMRRVPFSTSDAHPRSGRSSLG